MYSKRTIPLVRAVSAVINILISWGTPKKYKIEILEWIGPFSPFSSSVAVLI
ncbi:hypothetical protein BDV26DRAFT_260974 [Aspergillus bertholletiae]|uniref:Uncharacterized protein n=1 Tax=Aspergillus bertholletiae TaxID=1226010 RepID=A0A5N7BAM9_9EURO|nr:hypothetical protein BDV26DRAFT_260974 [Aspergillus bertholletiae]